MAAGDVSVTIVENPTAASIDTALTALRAAGGANGKYGVFSLNGRVVVWGIEEA
jgi:hypothetical protein